MTPEPVTSEPVAPAASPSADPPAPARRPAPEVPVPKGERVFCHRCGQASRLAQAFTDQHRLLGRKVSVCPECMQREGNQGSRGSVFFLVGAPLIGGLTLVAGFPTGWWLVNLGILYFWFVLVVPLHELGHLAVARLLGLDVPRVILGSGKEMGTVRFLGTRWHLHRRPFSGLTFNLHRRLRGFKWRHWLVVLGGPAVNLLLVWVVSQGMGFGPGDIVGVFEERPEPWRALLAANVLCLVVSLLPYRTASTIGLQMTDGMQLLTIPFWKPAMVEAAVAGSYVLEAQDRLDAEDREGFERTKGAGLELFPDHPILTNLAAVGDLEYGRFDRARESFVELLEGTNSDEPLMVAMLANNIAWANVMLEEPALLEEADALSATAVDLLPWERPLLGTRGVVLVLLNRLDEGTALITRALEMESTDRRRAPGLAALGIAYARSGDPARGREYLDQARQLAPRDPSLEVLGRWFESASAGAEGRGLSPAFASPAESYETTKEEPR
ncbi:MAG: site-2 protease family protein [Acidobacteriota bacterium]